MKTSLNLKRYALMLSIVLFSSMLLNSCRNPAYNIDVLFDASVIRYKATLMVTDANGGTLPDLKLTLSGADAGSIYDFSGTKAIYAPGGIITLGVNPNAEPTLSKPVNFNVIIKATGYDDVNIPIEIVNGQASQLQKLVMAKSSQNTKASTVASQSIPLNAAGKTNSLVTVATTANAAVPTITSLTIDAGTQLKNSAGTVLTGNSLTVNLTNYDNSDPLSISLFPGGKLASGNVVMPASSTPTKAFFIPAASSAIRMFVGTEEVKTFSQPITVTSQLDPSYVMTSTQQLVKAGDQLPIYSYHVETGQFSYESTGTVISSQGKLAVSFQTSHLTVFVLGEVFPTANCSATKVTYSANWLNDGTRPENIQLSTKSGRLIASSTLLMTDKLADILQGLPNIPLELKVIDAGGETLANSEIADPCTGNSLIVTLSKPSVEMDNITLQINVVCPGKGTIIVPNFDLYYRLSGSAEYNILGTAKGGLIKTTLLKKGSTYDFKAIWGSQIKNISKRTITALDLSTVVGQGLDLGKNTTANNALLIEACKSIN